MDRAHLAEEKADNNAPVLLTLLQKKRTIQTQQILDFLESEAADISDSELSRCRYREKRFLKTSRFWEHDCQQRLLPSICS